MNTWLHEKMFWMSYMTNMQLPAARPNELHWCELTKFR